MGQPYKICPGCQNPAQLSAVACSACGHQYRTQFVPPPIQQTQSIQAQPSFNLPQQRPGFVQVPAGSHSAVAAMLLSLFIPGGGQFYNQQKTKAIIVFLSAPGLFFFSLWLVFFTHGASFFLWFFIPVVWCLQVIDATLIAGRLNRGETVGDFQVF
jgi:hypothetical protein